ncbi:MAG: hypothetical protein QG600_622 [Patescibacteria group bacterium]|jgi:hypothetical protein|nr:hypothetical protein [Patescibacteria group bacterium]
MESDLNVILIVLGVPPAKAGGTTYYLISEKRKTFFVPEIGNLEPLVQEVRGVYCDYQE